MAIGWKRSLRVESPREERTGTRRRRRRRRRLLQRTLIRETISRFAEPFAIDRLHDFAPLALHPIPNKLSVRIHTCTSPVHARATAELVAGEVQQAGPPNETEAGFRDERDRALLENATISPSGCR